MNDSNTNEQFRHAELTKGIIGVFYDVYNELGHGFLESVYENALAIALRAKGYEVYQQGCGSGMVSRAAGRSFCRRSVGQ